MGASVGLNIKKRRTELRMSQTQLARLSGISQSAISDIENPDVTKRPSTETISKLAFALECTVAELMGEESAAPVIPVMSAQEQELLRLFRALNEKGQDWLMRSARMVHDDPEYSRQDTSNMAI